MIRILENSESLAELEPDWWELWRRAESPPFQSPAWLLPWWACFGTANRVVATLRENGRLCALLPLYVLDEASERKLLPLGVGLTDYTDLLADPLLPGEALDALFAAALDHAAAAGVTSCALPDLPPDAALRRVLAPPGWVEAALPSTSCPVLELPAVADPLAAVPGGMRRNIRQSRLRAERSGGWNVRVATVPEAPDAWKTLCAMQAERWRADGVLRDPRVGAFHDRAVPALASAGILRLYQLVRGGRVSAVYHALAAPGRLLFYLSGFDEADAFVSPGTLLMGHILDKAASDGVRELHFLRGNEAYKYAWGACDRVNVGRLLTRSR